MSWRSLTKTATSRRYHWSIDSHNLSHFFFNLLIYILNVPEWFLLPCVQCEMLADYMWKTFKDADLPFNRMLTEQPLEKVIPWVGHKTDPWMDRLTFICMLFLFLSVIWCSQSQVWPLSDEDVSERNSSIVKVSPVAAPCPCAFCQFSVPTHF